MRSPKSSKTIGSKYFLQCQDSVEDFNETLSCMAKIDQSYYKYDCFVCRLQVIFYTRPVSSENLFILNGPRQGLTLDLWVQNLVCN